MSLAFDYPAWVGAFPAFTNVTQDAATNYFNIASGIFDNINWPSTLTQAPLLLNLLTCHVARLLSPRDVNGNPSSGGPNQPPQLVGRINSANQGSVSLQIEYDSTGGPSKAWFIQTPEGAMFWQMTAQFRTGFYMGGLQRARNAAAATYVYPGRRFGGW